MIELSGSLLDKYDPQSDIARDLNSITSALARKDSTLWGTAASAEAAIRLNWIDLPNSSMELIPKLDQLRAWVAENKLSQIILCGMGGSSLAPEVLGKTFGRLTVLEENENISKRTAWKCLCVCGNFIAAFWIN